MPYVDTTLVNIFLKLSLPSLLKKEEKKGGNLIAYIDFVTISLQNVSLIVHWQ